MGIDASDEFNKRAVPWGQSGWPMALQHTAQKSEMNLMRSRPAVKHAATPEVLEMITKAGN